MRAALALLCAAAAAAARPARPRALQLPPPVPTLAVRDTAAGAEVTLGGAGGAALWYTTDGTSAAETGNPGRRRYDGPFLVAVPGVSAVRAAAWNATTPGPEVTRVVEVPLRPPAITPPGGDFEGWADVALTFQPGTEAYYSVVPEAEGAPPAAQLRATAHRAAADGLLRLAPSASPQVVAAVADHQGALSAVALSGPFRVTPAPATAPRLPSLPLTGLFVSLAAAVPAGTELEVTPSCPGVTFDPPTVRAAGGQRSTADFAAAGAALAPDCISLELGGSAAQYYASASPPTPSPPPAGAPVGDVDWSQARSVGVVLSRVLGAVSVGGVLAAIAGALGISVAQVELSALADARLCGGAEGDTVVLLRFAEHAQAFIDRVSDPTGVLRRDLLLQSGSLPYTVTAGMLCAPGYDYGLDSGSAACTSEPRCIALVLALCVTAAGCFFFAVLLWSQRRIQADRKGYRLARERKPGSPRRQQPPGSPQVDLCDPASWASLPQRDPSPLDPPNPMLAAFPQAAPRGPYGQGPQPWPVSGQG